jgi:hypothetical protein
MESGSWLTGSQELTMVPTPNLMNLVYNIHNALKSILVLLTHPCLGLSSILFTLENIIAHCEISSSHGGEYEAQNLLG